MLLLFCQLINLIAILLLGFPVVFTGLLFLLSTLIYSYNTYKFDI